MMSVQAVSDMIGTGSPGANLTPSELRSIVEEALVSISSNARVLAIIPDKTRDDNTNILFPLAAEALAGKRVKSCDVLVAQGTHVPMSEDEKLLKIGVKTHEPIEGLGQIYDHHWNDPQEIVQIGELSAERVQALTVGIYQQSIPVTINRLIATKQYDTLLVFSSTMPHEVAGLSGGAKYFFPGVAGPDLTHATHWVGALSTVERTIGCVETPVRHLIEAATDLIGARIITFNSVVTRTDEQMLRTHALFAGDFRRAFRRAAEVSRLVHIKYTGRKYARVVALLDDHYDDLWVGGKASYRLGGIIEEGGELIIYAPHLRCISQTHGHIIEKYGYVPLETVRELIDTSAELRNNLCVAAHLSQVAYASRINEDGKVAPRYKITLASQINEETCKRVNLGFLDFRNFNLGTYTDDSDTLVVERAGRDLYRMDPQVD